MTMNRYRIGVLVSLFALCSALLVAPALADEPQCLSDAAISAPAPVDEPQRSPATTVEAPIGPINRQSLRLAEMMVFSRKDREVKLRFTLGGVVHPAFQNPDPVALSRYPISGPLVTITVDLAVFRRP